MKKVLALVLAVVLAFGMTTVAFATKKTENIEVNTTLYTLDKKTITEADQGTLDPNTTYYMVINKVDEALDSGLDGKISTYSDLRIRTTIDDGDAYIVAKPSIVIKNIDRVIDAAGKKINATAWGNTAFITFKTADKFNKDPQDVTMTFAAYKGGTMASPEYTVAANTIAYKAIDASSVFTVGNGGNMVAFNDVEETEIYFEKNVDTYFVVNAKGQKDLFLRLDTSDDALEDKYPEASLDFFYFAGNNNTFRRTGTMHIPADMVENKDGKLVAPYLYENVSGKLTKIAGGEADKKAGPSDVKYDEDLAEFTFKTNKLGKYVISDIALKEASTSTDKNDTVEQNPDTGANDFVGLAVALAVVSVAGIAVAKRK